MMKEQFIKFLEDNEALKKFLYNLRNNGIDEISSIDELFMAYKLLKIKPKDYLKACFMWNFHEIPYWSKLHIKWLITILQAQN